MHVIKLIGGTGDGKTASISEEILERKVFSEMVITAIAKVVRLNGKVVASMVGKAESDFEEELFAQLSERNNTCAVFNFLTEQQKITCLRKKLKKTRTNS